MKLLLSVKITLKDYFPKSKSITYENFICLISHKNTQSQLRFSTLSEQNFIRQKIESLNSNIIYNIHIFDSIKKSLIGICQFSINFEKIKNLNINDILTQEENIKLIIDSKTKRKFFDNITNMGDIYLLISTEIKILNKQLYNNYSKENRRTKNKKNINIHSSNSVLNDSTAKSFKKKSSIRTMKNNYESLNILDNFYDKSYFNSNLVCDTENDYNTFYLDTNIKKNKSTNKAKVNLKNIIKINNDFYSKNNIFNNSSTELMSPKNNKFNYNYNNKKKIILNKNKINIMNLIDKKIDKKNYQTNINTYTNNFSKTQMGINFRKNEYNNYNTFNKVNKIKKVKEECKNLLESQFFEKKNKNKIQIKIFGKNNISTDRKIFNKKNLDFNEYIGMNTEITKNNEDIGNNNINNFNNIFLKTEFSASKLIPENQTTQRKNIFSEIKLNKNYYMSAQTQNNDIMNQSRGTFSPKLSLKIKLPEQGIETEKNDKNKKLLNNKLKTPKGNKIKYINFVTKKNYEQEKGELKKRYNEFIHLNSILMNKFKITYNNNSIYKNKLENIKQTCNYLNKCKNIIINKKNINEAIKIKNHIYTHYEEESILTKMINVKLKENSITETILGNIENENSFNKINILFSHKKETLLNLIKNVIKYYGNISQIYNDDSDKKIKFINSLKKYDIKEEININSNYFNYINKTKNFKDKIITEVDEEKENEEEIDYEDNVKKNKNNKINNLNELIHKDEHHIKEIKINLSKYVNKINNNKNKNQFTLEEDTYYYDENLNNLIEKILIEQFPQIYNTNSKFVHLEKNKYVFNDKILFAYIENNDVILKDIAYDKKYNLNEFYNTYCLKDKKTNFIYTKKIRQKYIKIKSYEDKEIYTDKRIKNENSTTMDTDFVQQSIISKGNEIIEEKI